jgi:hypothetical protein
MLRNRTVARSIADMGFHEFRPQLNTRQGSATRSPSPTGNTRASAPVPIRPRARSADAGAAKLELPGVCVAHNRDVNAAVNLKNMAAVPPPLPAEGALTSLSAKSTTITVMGRTAGHAPQRKGLAEPNHSPVLTSPIRERASRPRHAFLRRARQPFRSNATGLGLPTPGCIARITPCQHWRRAGSTVNADAGYWGNHARNRSVPCRRYVATCAHQFTRKSAQKTSAGNGLPMR